MMHIMALHYANGDVYVLMIVLKHASENPFSRINFNKLMKRQNIFRPILSPEFVIKCAAKIWKWDKEWKL